MTKIFKNWLHNLHNYAWKMDFEKNCINLQKLKKKSNGIITFLSAKIPISTSGAQLDTSPAQTGTSPLGSATINNSEQVHNESGETQLTQLSYIWHGSLVSNKWPGCYKFDCHAQLEVPIYTSASATSSRNVTNICTAQKQGISPLKLYVKFASMNHEVMSLLLLVPKMFHELENKIVIHWIYFRSVIGNNGYYH